MSEVNMTNQNRCDLSRDFRRNPNWYIESHRIILFRFQVNRRNVFSVQLLLRVTLFRRGMFCQEFWLSYFERWRDKTKESYSTCNSMQLFSTKNICFFKTFFKKLLLQAVCKVLQTVAKTFDSIINYFLFFFVKTKSHINHHAVIAEGSFLQHLQMLENNIHVSSFAWRASLYIWIIFQFLSFWTTAFRQYFFISFIFL